MPSPRHCWIFFRKRYTTAVLRRIGKACGEKRNHKHALFSGNKQGHSKGVLWKLRLPLVRGQIKEVRSESARTISATASVWAGCSFVQAKWWASYGRMCVATHGAVPTLQGTSRPAGGIICADTPGTHLVHCLLHSQRGTHRAGISGTQVRCRALPWKDLSGFSDLALPSRWRQPFAYDLVFINVRKLFVCLWKSLTLVMLSIFQVIPSTLEEGRLEILTKQVLFLYLKFAKWIQN